MRRDWEMFSVGPRGAQAAAFQHYVEGRESLVD